MSYVPAPVGLCPEVMAERDARELIAIIRRLRPAAQVPSILRTSAAGYEREGTEAGRVKARVCREAANQP